jgi:hypothetical protein
MSNHHSRAFAIGSCLLVLVGAAVTGAEPPPPDPALRLQLKGHTNDLKAIAFVPNSNRLITLDNDTCVRFWDLQSGTEEYKIAEAGATPGSLSIGNNGHPLLTYYSPLAVSPDGRFAAIQYAAFSSDGVEVFDLRPKKLQEVKPTKLGTRAGSLSFSNRGDRLAVAGGAALQWSLAEDKSLTPEKTAARPPNNKNYNFAISVTHLRGDEVMAGGLILHTIAFYNAQSGAELEKFLIPVQQPKINMFQPYQLALSPDGGFLLVVSRGADTSNSLYKPDNMMTLWDMTTGELAWTFTHEKFHVSQAAFSPDGRYVAVGFLNEPAVHLYRIHDNKEVAVFKGHAKGVSCIAFSPDGTMIASGSLDHTAIVWNVKEGLLAAAERPQADKDFARCWDTLRDGKPLEANEAIASLAAAGDDAVTWLESKLRPVDKPDAVKVNKWLAQLNDDAQPKRDEASRELAALGPLIETEIKNALADNPPAEVKRRLEELQRNLRSLWSSAPDTVRAVRSVYVLERIGSEKAVALLKKLAEGEAAARLTREAKISLERLEVRKPPKP